MSLILAANTMQGALRGIGAIGQAGLTDDNPEHIAIILEDCDWEAVVSSDGGESWRLAMKAELSLPLKPLPPIGQVQYRLGPQVMGYNPNDLHDRTQTMRVLLRSDDSGQTWTDVAPWSYLSQVLDKSIDTLKAQYLAENEWRIPDDQSWAAVFAWSSLGFGLLSTALFFWQRKPCLIPFILTIPGFFIMSCALVSAHDQLVHGYLYEQWNIIHSYLSLGIRYPRGPLGLFLQLTGNSWFAPVSAGLCFLASPLFAMLVQPSKGGRRLIQILGGMAILLVIALVGAIFLGYVPMEGQLYNDGNS